MIPAKWLNWRMLLVDDSDLSFGAKGMGLYLNTYMNEQHDFAFPSIATICGQLNLTHKTAIKYIEELVSAGYLYKERRFSKSNVYHSLIPEKVNEAIASMGNSPILVTNDSMGAAPMQYGKDSHPVWEGFPTNNQYNKQSNKQDLLSSEVSDDHRTPRVPYQKIIDAYHQHLPELPKVQVVTDKRKRAMKTMWDKHLEGSSEERLETMEAQFMKTRKSKFLMGDAKPNGDRHPFKANFDFLMREDVMVAIYEESKYF